MPSLNSRQPVQSSDRQSFNQLKALAESTDGPLRVEYKDNVPTIGIRSWPTYFFEKITCALHINSLKDIEKQTIEAIQSHASQILNNDSDTHDIPSHMLLHKLCARTSEKSLKPKLGESGFLPGFSTAPKYRGFSLAKATIRDVDVMMMIPEGLSITTKNTENIMADCHLVYFENTLPKGYQNIADTASKSSCNYMIPKTFMSDSIHEIDYPSQADFGKYYYDNLKLIGSSIHTCVAIEVFSDWESGTSIPNRNGAIQAAEMFMAERSEEENPVSISLSIKGNLPAVADKEDKRSGSAQYISGEIDTDSDIES